MKAAHEGVRMESDLDQVNEKFNDEATFIEWRLEKLREDLLGEFSITDLKDTSKWRATRIAPDDPIRKDRSFKFEMPLPNREMASAIKHEKKYRESSTIEHMLNWFRPAIYAYCALCEYQRTKDTVLDAQYGVYFAEWVNCKAATKRLKSYQGSASGAKRRRKKIDHNVVQEKLNQGCSRGSIATDLEVTVEAVRQTIMQNKLTEPKKIKKQAA